MTPVQRTAIPSNNLLTRPALILLLLSVAVLLTTALTTAQQVTGRLISSVETWEKFDTVGVSKKFVRGFQSALLDIGQGDFSFHVHAQGATALQHQLDELPDYRLYYAYAKMRNIANAVDVSVGRQPYFAGVGNGTLDGMVTTARMFDNKAKLTLYGGANLRNDITIEEWGPLKNNFTVGGQFLTTAIERMRLGVSYVNRQRERAGYFTIRPDSLFNPMSVFVEPTLAKEQYASGDVMYEAGDARINARYDYNIDSKETQRGQVGLRYQASNDLTFSGDYTYRAPRVLFNSFFSVFNTSSVSEVEAGVDYRFLPGIRGFLRGAYVKYTDDNSFRYTLGIAHNYFSVSYRGSGGYAGDLNTVSAQGAYPLFDNTLVPTAGLSYSSYTLNDNATPRNATAAVLGAIVRPIRNISFDVQGQWLHNKIVDSDFRLFAKLNYWFSEHLNLFE